MAPVSRCNNVIENQTIHRWTQIHTDEGTERYTTVIYRLLEAVDSPMLNSKQFNSPRTTRHSSL